MSKPADQPLRGTKLSDELVKVESILGAVSLPDSGVQRDELMFRAGRAAEASATAAQRRQVTIAGRRAMLVSSTCSAAIAASLAVATMWFVRPSTDAPIMSNADSSRELGIDNAAEPVQTGPENGASLPTRSHFARRDEATRTAPLLVMRDQVLAGPVSDPWSMASAAAFKSPADQRQAVGPKTSWEMLQEFLPSEVSPGGSKRTANPNYIGWPWSIERWGEAI